MADLAEVYRVMSQVRYGGAAQEDVDRVLDDLHRELYGEDRRARVSEVPNERYAEPEDEPVDEPAARATDVEPEDVPSVPAVGEDPQPVRVPRGRGRRR